MKHERDEQADSERRWLHPHDRRRHPTVNELYDAMMAMKAECDRIARQIPDTQIIITGTIKGPPENLATTGGNVFITFPRRKPVDIAWLVPWLKGVKGYELPEGYTGARTVQIPAQQTDGTWVMLDLLQPVDTSKFPERWQPLCELGPMLERAAFGI